MKNLFSFNKDSAKVLALIFIGVVIESVTRIVCTTAVAIAANSEGKDVTVNL